ncbi:uncharacterized protein A4U43_C06F7560 [Asparagus officinalis]|uniref:Uncharacterized protein n=1 Tax=Asparagus officinalis TaxID=4686 RepID=A0A5P1EML0_ASPOF|nr:uncharacterized protein A4U43_C06F7560 [Asparagus officinalis]
MDIDPVTHRRRTDLDILSSLPALLAAANIGNLTVPSAWDNALRIQADAANLANVQMLQSLMQLVSSNYSPLFDATCLLGSNGNQFGDVVQLNRQLEAVLNGSLSLAQAPVNNLHLGDSVTLNNLQEQENVIKNEDINSYANVSMPSLVSASPENVASDQAQEPSQSNSSSSMHLEAWEGLNPDDDFGLKDILE